MGYVYILTNKAMPGLIKIGQTARTVQERVDELYTTGVPIAFDIAHEFECENHEQLESQIHRELERHRFNRNREFFEYSADEAFQVLQRLANSSWRKHTSHFLTRFRKKVDSIASRIGRKSLLPK